VARPEPPPLPPPVAPPPAITPLPPPNIVVAGITARSDPVPKADLIVTKVATPSSVVLGSTVRYVVQVRNRGPATARNVTLVERTTPITRFLRLRTDQGSCRGAIPRRCTIGTLRAGDTATVTVDVRTRRAGTFTNIVAANTSTEVKSLRTMSARARIRVLRAAGARFTG